jgi:hypothetical protein
MGFLDGSRYERFCNQRLPTICYGLVYFVRQYGAGCLHAAVAHEPSSGTLYDYLVWHDGVPLLNLVI